MVVAAHPDDEVLGCGGTIAKLVKRGYEVYTLILGEGITSRDIKRDPNIRKEEIEKLRTCMCEANRILGVARVFAFDFPDNRFDSVDFLDIVKVVEEVKDRIKPEVIFTHSKSDLNIDHKITYMAVITATRPLKEESVKQIYSFEVLSSTEWNYPVSFSPNVYYNIESTIDLKLRALEKYELELRKYPHPRSIEGVVVKAKQRGMEAGFLYAEAFELIRSLVR